MPYLEVCHAMADLHQLLGAFDVHLDGFSQLLVEPDGRRRIENYRHVVDEQLHVGRDQTEAFHRHIAGNRHQLVHGAGAFTTHYIENLLKS